MRLHVCVCLCERNRRLSLVCHKDREAYLEFAINGLIDLDVQHFILVVVVALSTVAYVVLGHLPILAVPLRVRLVLVPLPHPEALCAHVLVCVVRFLRFVLLLVGSAQAVGGIDADILAAENKQKVGALGMQGLHVV